MLLLDRLDSDAQRDFVADVRGVLAIVELGALDLGGRVRAAGFFLQHRMRHAVEGRDFEAHRLGDSLDRQVPVHRAQLVAREVKLARLECDRGEFFRIEEVFALEVAIEDREAAVHAACIDRHVDRTGFRRAVEHDRAAGLVEAADLGRVAEVAVLEAWVSVRAVDGVGFRRGSGAQGQSGSHKEEGDFFHGSNPGR